jgi:hypothetical protein
MSGRLLGGDGGGVVDRVTAGNEQIAKGTMRLVRDLSREVKLRAPRVSERWISLHGYLEMIVVAGNLKRKAFSQPTSEAQPR